jgi:hypothetical protein
VKRPQISIFYGGSEIPQNGTIDAGEVLVTLSKNINVEIRNTGEDRLEIETTNITITGTDEAAFTRTTSPAVSMGPGGSTLFSIRCAPTKVGENIAIISIPTNDDSRNPYVINIKTTGVKGNAIPELSYGSTVIANNCLTPIDFGTVELGSTNDLTFNIKNNGNIALLLTGTLAVVSSNTVFTIPSPPANTTIAPEATVSFIIRYTPTAEVVNNGTITIANNSDDMLFTFPVRGTGYEKKPQITVRQGTTSISPLSEYDFGSVLAGKNSEITFTIGNSGEANLNIIPVSGARISLTNNAAGIFSITQQPSSTVIIPGGTTTFVVRFSPTAIGAVSTATVQIKTDSREDEEFSFTIKGTGRNYIIGDEGPGGGIVFYDAGGVIDGWRYLEVSLTNFTAEWGAYGYNVAGTGLSIGSGKQNTQLIVAALNITGETGRAAQICANLNVNGFNDWFLPSQDELNQLYLRKSVVDMVGYDRYWSSSQYNVGNGTVYAWGQYFYNGEQYNNPKTNTYSVRPIRSF